ncbi:choice-of-anchor D domain-containing protein [Reichenbachiella carrageenanivorans]|uniref:Choice-of-anchor D domain-containing protein n=1 Tax=Reichenbachiella carrageenanivorans TaxID=2979869 RepID=A0ABY6D7F4_9BACT|nr:choice-of-anchor D domain-containing protein [Reichenbachiella carrageenanivorans]UXX80998.1 choice-of-anchor D domain-containing protein [Reichenbachiella carrageenanivorans]
MKKLLLLTAILYSGIYTAWAQNVTIDGTKAAQPIYPKMAGYNSNTANIPNPWTSSGRRETWEKSEAGLIRYPGGTVSSYWDHKKDRMFDAQQDDISLSTNTPSQFIQKKNVINWVVTFTNQPNPLSDLNKLIEDSNGDTEVMFVLNLITPGADYYSLLWDRSVDETPLSDDWWAMMDDRYANALDMLERAEAEGIPVKYIEYGNEYFFDKSYAGTGSTGGAAIEPYSAGAINGITGAFPGSGEHYADAVNDWSAKLAARFPGVNLCAIGSDANSDSPTRRNKWNEVVISKIDKSLVQSLSFHIYGGTGAYSLTDTEDEFGDALKSIDEHWEFDSTRSDMPKGFDYWMTEFDASSNKTEDGEKSWGLGLASLHQAGMWMDMGNLGLINFHQFGDLGNNGSITAFGRAYAMLGMASNNCSQAERLIFGSNVKIGTGSDVNAIEGWQFSQNEEGSTRYMIVNRSGSSQTITTSGLTAAQGEKVILSSSNNLSRTSDPSTTETTLGASLTIPKYGIAYFSTPADPNVPRMAVFMDTEEVKNQSIVTLPEIDINVSSTVTKTFTLKNTGDADVNLSGSPIVTLLNDAEDEFSVVQTSLTTPLEKGADQTFTVTFTAKSAGSKSAQIQIINNTNTKNPYTFNLSIAAKDYYPQMEVSMDGNVLTSPEALDFGTTYTGWSSVTKTLLITNTGTTILTFDSNTKLTADGFSSGTMPSTINPGASVPFSINLKTLEVGSKTGTLILSSDSRTAGVFEVDLTGTVEQSVATAQLTIESENYLTASNYDFGELGAEETSMTKTVIITNIGTQDLEIGDFMLTDANGAFSYDDTLLKRDLEPNKVSSFKITYEPQSGSDFDAVLTFAITEDSDFVFNLKGSKVNPVLSVTNLQSDLAIYPSLWQSGSTITLNSKSSKMSVSVYSIRGQQMGSSSGTPAQLSEYLTQLNTQLPNGLYLIKTQDSTQQLIKIIKR